MFDRILLATDGSEPAAAAADSAISLARQRGSELVVLHVEEVGERPPGVEDADASPLATRAREAVERVADQASDAGVPVTTVVREATGPSHEAIVEYAVEEDCDLIVMGTHGHTGLDRYVLGSVAERTMRSAQVPVLVVTADHPLGEAVERVVVATDGSDVATRAAERAIELAAAAGGTLHVVNVVDLGVVWDDVGTGMMLDALEEAGQAAVDDVVEQAEAAGVSSVEGTVLTGRPHRAIIDYAGDVDADVLVVGTHGRSGIDRLLLGSVAERVVRVARMPVLAVGGAGAK